MHTALAIQPSIPAPIAAPPPWICVVERDQVWRNNKSGVLFEVASVKMNDIDARVTLSPVGSRSADDEVYLGASALCAGSAWSRLPDNDGETTLWGGRLTLGPRAAGAPS